MKVILAICGETQSHDRRAFDLRLDPFRIDERAAIDRGIDPGNAELALVVDRDLDDGRDVADEAAVHGDAKPVIFGQAASPAALVRDEFDDPAQTRRIDRIAVVGFAVVPEVLGEWPGRC